MDLLYINNKLIDLDGQLDIKITMQVNEIAQIDKSKSNFTNTIKVPKTKNNVNVLNQLSLPGDLSRIPYKKNECRYIRDGVPLINKGWAVVKSTADSYSIYIYEGVYDLYKDIGNLTLGDDLDLSDINHTKSMNAVLDSFTNPNYCYLITDYNGKTHVDGKINIDYLVPSVRVKYLMDKIQDKIGWYFFGSAFDGERKEEYENLWMTYPKPLLDDDESSENEAANTGLGSKNLTYQIPRTIPRDEMLKDFRYKAWEYFNVIENEAEKLGDWGIKVLKEGTFKLDFTLFGHCVHKMIYKRPFPGSWESDTYSRYILDQMQLVVYVNGDLYDEKPITGNSVQAGTSVIDFEKQTSIWLEDLKIGDIVTFALKPLERGTTPVQSSILSQNDNSAFLGTTLVLKTIRLSMFRLSGGAADFTTALSDFKVSDFVKEVLYHFGLTIFTDKYDKKAEFATMEDRISKANVYNYTDYFIERTNEQYQMSSYAQKNRLKYKYNDEESDYNDGIIVIDDVNLENEKTVIESRIYTPEKELTDFKIEQGLTRQLHIYKIWEKEPNENNGVIEIKYKGLDKRFYFVRKKEETFSNVTFISEQLGGEPISGITKIPLADYSGLKYQELVENNYSETRKILTDTRIHTVSLNLPLAEVSIFDMKGLFYFQQEGQYYFPNKLNYSKTRVSGEFVRVQYNMKQVVSPPLVDSLIPISGYSEFDCVEAKVLDITNLNLSITVQYTRGNGQSYPGITVGSNENPNFKATLEAGILNLGDGELTFTLSGILPIDVGQRTFNLELFGVNLLLQYGFAIYGLTDSFSKKIWLESNQNYTLTRIDFPISDDKKEWLKVIRFTDLSGLNSRATLKLGNNDVEAFEEILMVDIINGNLVYSAPKGIVPEISSVLSWQGKTETGCFTKDAELTIINESNSNIP